MLFATTAITAPLRNPRKGSTRQTERARKRERERERERGKDRDRERQRSRRKFYLLKGNKQHGDSRLAPPDSLPEDRRPVNEDMGSEKKRRRKKGGGGLKGK